MENTIDVCARINILEDVCAYIVFSSLYVVKFN